VAKKKAKKNNVPKSNTESNTSQAKVAVLLRLDDLRKQAGDAIAREDWAAITRLGRHALQDFQEIDHIAAATWLARARTLGLLENGRLTAYSLSPEERLELHEALEFLALAEDKFYSKVQFRLYLDVFRHNWNHTDSIIKKLIEACTDAPNAEWLCELREVLLFVDAFAHSDKDSDPAREAVAALYNKPRALLQQVYQIVEQGAQLDTFELQFLKVFLLEEQLVMADPWDIQELAAQIRELPSPTASELIISRGEKTSIQQRLRLTPDGWAFLAELTVTSVTNFKQLLDRYPAQFGCMPCDILRQIAACIVAPNDKTDAILSNAIETLFAEDDAWQMFFGESLAVQSSNGIEELYLGHRNLHLTNDFDSYLLQFYEGVSNDHRYSSQLGALYRVFSIRGKGETLESDSDMQGLHWLCERSLMFHVVCANLLPRFGQRMAMLVTALAQSGEELKDIPEDFYCWVFSEDDEISPEDTAISLEDEEEVINALRRLSAVRSSLGQKGEGLWLEAMGPIFKSLSEHGKKLRHITLQAAREFKADLLRENDAFRLAFLEQVVGDKEAALTYYLRQLESNDAIDSGVIQNMKLLWSNLDDIDTVARMVNDLESAKIAIGHKAPIDDLLKNAKARKKSLNEKVQFEKTAVNRWPSITAPARKVLGVLSNINSYNGFHELGEYAGMQADWAERHYKKLVETGMVFLSASGSYHINPHIKPLLDLESQHSVVGRIVRSQGTSAVKQVFNSQREFTIYQVLVQLCPNHLVFPNCSLQSIMTYEKMKELVSEDDFGYYLRASVDIVVVSSSTYLPMLAIEVDSAWHDTERQQKNDEKKDRLFATAGVPFMRLRPVGTPSENVVRGQVAEHLDELVRSLRADLPGYEQVRGLLEDLSGTGLTP